MIKFSNQIMIAQRQIIFISLNRKLNMSHQTRAST